MKQKTEMLDALFHHATEGIIVVQGNAQIVMVNPIAEKLFGYSKDELVGNSIETLIPLRYTSSHVKQRDNYIVQPSSRRMGMGRDLYALRKDGSEFPVEVSLSHFSTSEGEFIMSFIVDITERKKQEEELQNAHKEIIKLNTKLEQRVEERTEELAQAINNLAESKQEVMRALEREKELNELKSRFVSTASHEFRTPLATILFSVSLISKYDNEEDKEKRLKHIEKIKSSVNHLTQILNDFLSLSKLEEGVIHSEPEAFEVNVFINTLAEEMKEILKKDQYINCFHSGATWVELDKHLLKNILINLLSNSIKYSPNGGEITVSSYFQNEAIVIEVKDRGIGIPEEDQAFLFERFFRAHNAGTIQGTGLGLNIVKRYIELMNGTIHFTSRLNEGTTFIIEFPIKKK